MQSVNYEHTRQTRTPLTTGNLARIVVESTDVITNMATKVKRTNERLAKIQNLLETGEVLNNILSAYKDPMRRQFGGMRMGQFALRWTSAGGPSTASVYTAQSTVSWRHEGSAKSTVWMCPNSRNSSGIKARLRHVGEC
jgi:hypothetical protein